MKFQPLQLGRRPESFSHPDWLFEIKTTVSALWPISSTGGATSSPRNGNEFKSFRTLSESLATELKRSVILDGEIVCLDGDGKSLF